MTDPPTVMPSHLANLPELPVIPPDAQDVDLKQFPVFALSRDAQFMERFDPIGSNIPGFNAPVDRMSELKPASGTHVFIYPMDC
eukprot:264595-Amphidinium_carterae.2